MTAKILPFPGNTPISVEGVCREYRLNKMTVTAVKNVSLSVTTGSFYALAGSSGSGKSTLLNLMGGIDRPTSGRVLIGGQELGTLNQRDQARLRAERIGFIFQTFNLLPVLTALENVEYPLLLLGVGAAERRARAQEALTKVGLEKFGPHKPGDMSGGQRQRVAIARALVKKPSVILADEPTANLDQATTKEILTLLDGLRTHENLTIVIASHDPLVLARATDGVRLCDGSVTSALERQAA